MSTRFFMLVVTVAAIIWFTQLGYRDLIEPDEGRYAEIPREMVATGDWVTPRLNGFKYFEKPVLQYWATAMAYTLFGDNTTTARLWPALTGFLGALWAGFLGLRLYGRSAGFYAFLITLSGLLYFVDGHYLLLDMSLAVFLFAGVGCLVLAQRSRDDAAILRNWMLAGWTALALATLSKGLIGVVLPAATVVVYSLWARDWVLWRQLHIVKGLAVFLLVTAPWFIAVSLANPEFPQFFFIHEHLQRYTSTVHEREGAYWYFVPVFLLGIFPWVAVALKSLLRPGFSSRSPGMAGFDAERFLWSFALVVFVFFSAGQSKLPSYILPMMPVVAILAGRKLATEGYHRVDAWLLAIMALALLLTGWQIELLASDSISADMYLAYRPWIFAGAGLYVVAALLANLVPRLRTTHIAAVGLLALLAAQVVLLGFQSLAASRSSNELARAIRANVPEGTEIFALASYPQSLAFYMKQTLTLVIVTDEMKMGIQQEPDRWIGSEAEFLARWAAADQAVAVFRDHDLEKYMPLLEPARIIYSGPRRAAVIKP
ncbi:MAG: phospholipid carrier-dependent glycosyltransferase [Gammaproteobacteria bacterium]